MKRVTTMDAKLIAHPVAIVKKDHHTTIRISTVRAPKRSPRYPLGISNRAYARTNAEKTYPICSLLNPRSREMSGAACEMQTRST